MGAISYMVVNPTQFEQFQLFNPGPPVAPPVNHAKEAMEFASRPDVTWHASDKPVVDLEYGRQFHTGTATSAFDRADAARHPVAHPVVLSGRFQLATDGHESGVFTTHGDDYSRFSRFYANHPTRWSDRVVNNYDVLPSEYPPDMDEVEGKHGGFDARDAAIRHLDKGAILPYTNETEDPGSTSYVTINRKNVRFFHDEPKNRNSVLTGRFIPQLDHPAVEQPPLPFSSEDSERLDIQSIFHNNVPAIHHSALKQMGKYFDTPVGLHPSSPLAQIPPTETAKSREHRLAWSSRFGPAGPNIFLGLSDRDSSVG